MRILVRARAWWVNKVPLSVTFYLLLIDGGPLDSWRVAGLLALVATVCAGSNFAYALNDLYDRDEDALAGRANAAATLGARRIWAIVAGSVALAIALPALAAGLGGVILSVCVLLLPFAYSMPPLRIKERKWLGVVSDALAAHVAPIALALLIVQHLPIRTVSPAMASAALLWALAAGLRGILSHQVQTADTDAAGGLSTIVHDVGPARVILIIVTAVLPVEVIAFAAFIVTCDVGAVMGAAVALYLAYEARKTVADALPTTAFHAQGQPYLPFIDEAFYKAWGPIAVALDAATHDLAYLALIPDYILLFGVHVASEGRRIAAVWRALPPPSVWLARRAPEQR